jgi:type II secretory pathway pseudopilin PulG
MKQESGRSMIEMLGVLAIMGVITVAAVSMITYGMKQQKRSNVADEITQIVTGVRSLLGQYDDFSNLNNGSIWGAIGMSAKNPFGGNYTLSVDSSNPRQFIIEIDGLSQSDCEYLSARAWADSADYILSDGKRGGATGSCTNTNGKNTVKITFGE